MSEIAKYVVSASPSQSDNVEYRRASAVAAALEVIAAKASQSGAHVTHLDREMANLSKYADQIQEALKVK